MIVMPLDCTVSGNGFEHFERFVQQITTGSFSVRRAIISIFRRICNMTTPHSLDSLKHYHHEARSFFGSQLFLLNEVILRIKDDRLGKAATLLLSWVQRKPTSMSNKL
jgi:hypothetical protein